MEVVKHVQRKYPNCRVEYVWNSKPLGIGAAYRLGFSRIPKTITHVLTMDADLNHDPADLPKFIQAVTHHHADIVIGSRFIAQGAFHDRRGWKRLVSRLVNYTIMVLLRLHIHDLTSGFRLIRAEVIQRITPTLREKGYPAYMEFALAAHRHGFRLIEVPIVYSPRTWGKSKMGTKDTLAAYLSFIRRMLF